MNLTVENLLTEIPKLSGQAKLDAMSELAFIIKDMLAYRDWKRKVNFQLIQKCNMTADDLPDYCYRDDYDNKVTPARSASRAIRNAKTCF